MPTIVHYGVFPDYKYSQLNRDEDLLQAQNAEISLYRYHRRSRRAIGGRAFKRWSAPQSYTAEDAERKPIPDLQFTVNHFGWTDVRGVYNIYVNAISFQRQLAEKMPT